MRCCCTAADAASWVVAWQDYCVKWGLDESTDTLLPDAICPRKGHCVPASCDPNLPGEPCKPGVACATVGEMYVYSLYFAIMTITSVGYGDSARAARSHSACAQHTGCTLAHVLR